MARQNHGPLTRAKGKLGGVVYQQYEGMQIAREYQPNVKNPQSDKQTENRAKFKMASQITAEFKEVILARLAKLSIYTRMRRAASVNAIYNIIDTTTPSTPSALVGSVVDAINAKSVSALEGPTISNIEGASQTITATSGDICTYVNCTYNNDGSLAGKESETYTSDGTAKSVDTYVGSGERSVIMAVSYHAITEDGLATISNIGMSNSGDITNTIARSVANGDIEVSNILWQFYSR